MIYLSRKNSISIIAGSNDNSVENVEITVIILYLQIIYKSILIHILSFVRFDKMYFKSILQIHLLVYL